MRYQASDGISQATFDLDRNFGDALVRANLLKEAPAPRPRMPNETLFLADGQRIETPVEDVPHFALLSFVDGRPYLQCKTNKGTDQFSGVDPNSDRINWPADLVASYQEQWQFWLDRKNND